MEGSVDAAAIDSTVLEIASEQDPTIEQYTRILATLGPSPIPPLVISKQIEVGLRTTVKTLIVDMHRNDLGRRILDRAKIRRFEIVGDADYDPIRDMARKARDVPL
jgi:phosphonate transport system substrate-binding protein